MTETSNSRIQSRTRRVVLAVAVPFIVQSLLNVIAVAVSDQPIYNYIGAVAPVISLIAGFVFLIRERWRLVIGLVYFPVMFVALVIFSTLMGVYLFGFDL